MTVRPDRIVVGRSLRKEWVDSHVLQRLVYVAIAWHRCTSSDISRKIILLHVSQITSGSPASKRWLQ
jgi:hypothetical protein